LVNKIKEFVKLLQSKNHSKLIHGYLKTIKYVREWKIYILIYSYCRLLFIDNILNAPNLVILIQVLIFLSLLHITKKEIITLW